MIKIKCMQLKHSTAEIKTQDLTGNLLHQHRANLFSEYKKLGIKESDG
jgi:hypothetical protein